MIELSARVRTLALLALLAVCLSACTRTGKTTTSFDRSDANTLRIAVAISPTQLNPILHHNQIESSIDGLIFDKLVTIDNHGNEVPDLAAAVPTLQNGGINRSGLTITYHLRHGVFWQDGTPFTSADVKFSWEAILNPKNNVAEREGYMEIASIGTPDPYTVVLHMKKVFPPEVDTFFAESDAPDEILPRHLLAKYQSLNRAPFDSAPVGTGPYEFVSWTRGQDIVLRANRRYFRGAPRIHTITIDIIPDENTMAILMRAHELDLALAVPAVYYHNLVRDPGLVGRPGNSPQWEGILFNTSQPPLNDLRVRRALSFAIDRAALIRDLSYGIGTVANADLTRFSWAYDTDLAPVPHDPAKARALLAAAGWRMGPSGVRVKNGKALSLVLAYGQGSVDAQDMVEAVQQQLASVGVEVSLKSYAYTMLFAASEDGGILRAGKYGLTLYDWVGGTDPNDSGQWTCDMVPPVGNNISRYCSPQMDRAERLALSTFNRAMRKRAYRMIETLLEHDAPAAFLIDRSRNYIYSSQLKNFAPNGISEGWNAQDWQLQ